MADWKFAIGNLATRAPRAAVPVSPAEEDPLLPLSNLASGQPDEEAAFEWRSDGAYQADKDLNLLAESSERSDAPTGWRDLLLALAGTPGLASDPPDWGSYASRSSLRVFWPTMQEIDVMPGEDFKLEIGLHWPTAAAGATGARVRVTDTWSGKSWDGTTDAWTDTGVVAEQTVADAWLDVSETIVADANRLVRSTYRVVIEPVGASYDATSYVYFSMNATSGSPALYAKADMVALLGHNLPVGATVTVGTETVTVTPVSCIAEFTAKFLQTWRLDIAMPAGNQPRPRIGELWIGAARTFLKKPLPGIAMTEGDQFQLRVEGAQGRMEVLSDQRLPAQKLMLTLKTTGDAPYEQYRSELTRGTKFGKDPMLLIPEDDFDGDDRVIHGRVGQVVAYSVTNKGWRSFSIEFAESPFAGAS